MQDSVRMSSPWHFLPWACWPLGGQIKISCLELQILEPRDLTKAKQKRNGKLLTYNPQKANMEPKDSVFVDVFQSVMLSSSFLVVRNLGHPLSADQIPIQLLSWLLADMLAAGTGGWMSFFPVLLLGCQIILHRSTQDCLNDQRFDWEWPWIQCK